MLTVARRRLEELFLGGLMGKMIVRFPAVSRRSAERKKQRKCPLNRGIDGWRGNFSSSADRAGGRILGKRFRQIAPKPAK
jgi:hypothetical protein